MGGAGEALSDIDGVYMFDRAFGGLKGPGEEAGVELAVRWCIWVGSDGRWA